MKNLLKTLCASMLLVAAGCSDEQVVPLQEDLKTSANYYWDRYFSIHLQTNYEDELTFFLGGTGGEVTVHWGDGSSETIYVGNTRARFEHDYQTEGDPWEEEENRQDFVIRVSGDLKTITSFNFYYSGLYIKEIHFGGLTNLTDVSMGALSNGPSVINLGRNNLIENVIVGSVQNLEELLLPTPNRISGIEIAGSNNLTTADVDRIIARVHDSVVKSPRGGFFSLQKYWWQDEDDMSMVGPPSSYSINKLRKLKDVYGWRIFPDVN